ncbi:carbon-nitrogen hydrolase family protein [Pararhizobium sp. IMCC21322]|uniref:carbon-nitrogen hydrolase family protein n=1 Tax=Pararhizobium sp. IMCC21322 TaxID=3067903 RepID=UPI0027404D69|nr:carbon-nitrogen hydrolase family protein [Pararhizobium sp. IMCC21322]
MSQNSFKAACIQMNSGTSVSDNMAAATELIRAAAARGAHYIQTPEMTTIVQQKRSALLEAIAPEQNNPSVTAFAKLAGELKIWLHIGSMAVALPKSDGGPTIANRAFLFQPDGNIAASYDKIHMFDVDLDSGESWRESRAYRAGSEAVLVEITSIPGQMRDQIQVQTSVKLGLSICYDLRFAALFRTYAQAGAIVLGAPSAFTRQTGAAHWRVLQRARAIENGAFMISAAQVGTHQDGRETYGHSVIIDPWGTVLAEADGENPGFITADIDPDLAKAARRKIPALTNDQPAILRLTTQSAAA